MSNTQISTWMISMISQVSRLQLPNSAQESERAKSSILASIWAVHNLSPSWKTLNKGALPIYKYTFNKVAQMVDGINTAQPGIPEIWHWPDDMLCSCFLASAWFLVELFYSFFCVLEFWYWNILTSPDLYSSVLHCTETYWLVRKHIDS